MARLRPRELSGPLPPLPKPKDAHANWSSEVCAAASAATGDDCMGALDSRLEGLEVLQLEVLKKLRELRAEAFCNLADQKKELSSSRELALKSENFVSQEFCQVHIEEGKAASAYVENSTFGNRTEPSPQNECVEESVELSRSQSFAYKSGDILASTRDKMALFIKGPFDLCVGVVVALNTIVMIVSSQYDGMDADASLGLSDNTGRDFAPYEAALDHMFLGIYVLEVIVRVGILRREWLVDEGGIMYSNVFDAAIVLVSMIDSYILSEFAEDSPNVGAVRWLRLLRVAKSLRLVRMSTLFRHLRILVKTIISSLSALIWSLVILLLAQVTYALILCQALNSFITDITMDYDTRFWVNRMFGNFVKSMYTMFEITFSGSWPTLARPVIEQVSPWYAIIFLSYVVLVVFACIRVITALFIKETMSIAASDTVLAVQERMRIVQNYVQKLRHVFVLADTDRDGFLSCKEFTESLKDPVVTSYLSIMDLEVNEVEPLFQLLDDGQGLVTIDEFVTGLTRLKGQARALDVVVISHDVQRIADQLNNMEAVLQKLITR